MLAMIQRFQILLVSVDIDSSVDFYTNVISGFRVAWRSASSAEVVATSAGTTAFALRLLPPENGRAPSDFLTLTVSDASDWFDRVKRRISEFGIGRVLPSALPHRNVGPLYEYPGGCFFAVEDPSGNIVTIESFRAES